MQTNLLNRWLATMAMAASLTACGGGSGSLSVLVEAEDVIIEGLEPGTDGENIQDGWAVSFDKYLVAIGDVDVSLSTDESVAAEAADLFVVDLTQVPAAGLPLWSLDELEPGRWDFNYATGGAGDGATRQETAAQADFDEMVANDWTYLVDGTMSKMDGVSCPPASLATPPMGAMPVSMNSGGDDCYANPTIRFVIGATAETGFGPCEVDEVPGFNIADGATLTVAATIHGDHLFFNGFPESDEGGVMRLAQWMADCDLNLDGEVTRDELEAIAPSALNELDDRYQLGGSPITPLNEMWDYVVAQLKTQGHYQGEGECPIDGVAHEH